MFIAIRIHNFCLQAALRLQAQAVERATVLVESSRRGSVVVELNGLAQRSRILPGMEVSKALARCGDVQVLNRTLPGERAATRLMWSYAWSLTPHIELTEPGLLTLDVQGDPQQWAQGVDALLQRLRRHGLYARGGVAPTREWARLAALAAERGRWCLIEHVQQAHALFAHLPLSAAVSDARACAILTDWGILHLGALARLPRQALGERLGCEFLQLWDVLNGRESRPLRVEVLDPEFIEQYEFEEPVEHLEPVLFILRRLLDVLEGQLGVACKVAKEIDVVLRVVDAVDYSKSIRLPEPTRDAALLQRILQHHFEQVKLGGAVSGFSIQLQPVAPLGRQGGLFEKSLHNPWRLRETLDQLAGLVGIENMGSPRVCDSYAEDAFSWAALPEELAAWDAPQGPPHRGLIRHAFRPKLSVYVKCVEQQPAAIESTWVEGRVVNCHGPYRRSGRWWTPQSWAVEEWDVEVEAVGVFRLQRAGRCWLLVGAYD